MKKLHLMYHLVLGILTVHLLAVWPSVGRSQDAPPPPAGNNSLPANVTPVEPGKRTATLQAPEAEAPAVQGISGGTERTWSGPSSPGGPKTFWETVPPITPYPRTGNFYIMPSGPGTYTFLDFLRGREVEDRPHNPYLQWGQNPNPFFNVDFRYLDNPANTETDWLDPLKRIHLSDNWLFSTGGEIRDRLGDENNYRLYNKVPLAGDREIYDLFRARVYADVWYLDRVRFFAEFMSADATGEMLPQRSSDVDRADILNMFIDLKLLTIADQGLYIRGGRQELQFGSQRMISPSDWSNAIRTFQGIRGFWHGENLELDTFWVQPVVVSRDTLSSVDDKQVFVGDWLKYRLNKDSSIDAYYLYLDNANAVAKGTGGVTGGYDVNTFGGRFVGEKDRLLWDFEDAVQFGRWSNQGTIAGMSTSGVGWYFKNLPATPTAWVYYDFASGDPTPGVGPEHHTFNPMFPFGHQYFDGLDIIGRENIKDFHVDLALFPTNWMRVTYAYHYLALADAKDALYDPTGNVVRQDTTGKAGTDVGNALSSSTQFHIDNHQVLNISYAHLFSGEFIKKTAVDANAAKDMDSFWVQYTFKW